MTVVLGGTTTGGAPSLGGPGCVGDDKSDIQDIISRCVVVIDGIDIWDPVPGTITTPSESTREVPKLLRMNLTH